MTDSEEDGSIGGSGDEGQHEEGHDEVEILEETTSIDTDKPILCFPERNDPDTGWTRDDGTFPACGKNKMKTEDMETVHKRKELLSKEVAKKETGSLLDRWIHDKVKPAVWNKNATAFPARHVFVQTHVRSGELISHDSASHPACGAWTNDHSFECQTNW